MLVLPEYALAVYTLLGPGTGHGHLPSMAHG